jgi:sarcosine oxidase, subunit alpha
MPASRLTPPKRPVTLRLDGQKVVADEGEPVAQALIAADRLVLARSPKLHRPRGPSCMRGSCDGCLSRVDGAPNVMTCLVPARDGMVIETQNVVGTRNVDLLRVTDWFFPDGMDHHHFLAGVPGLSGVMQHIARRVAGLGTMPTRARGVSGGKRTTCDALVVGAGPSGTSAASALARSGLSVVLVDDGLAVGGSARALGGEALARLAAAAPLGGVRVLARTTAAGIYGGEALLAGPEGAELCRPRALLLATGAHDAAPLFEGNDVPGVFSARAAAQMAAAGVSIGQRIIVTGDGPYADALCRHLDGEASVTRAPAGSVVRIEGATRVGGVVLHVGNGYRRQRADAVAVDAPPSPAYELCEQAGGSAIWRGEQGFVPRADAAGRLEGATGAWVLGEARGVACSLETLIDEGAAVAAQVALSLA